VWVRVRGSYSLPSGREDKGETIRAVVQRVNRCSVSVEGRELSEIAEGLLVLLGVAQDDGEREARYLADKIINLRIFPDEDGRMNLSVADIAGELMVVSQFTLLADTRKGRRPSFVAAADPGDAERLYDTFVALLSESGLRVGTGEFGAMMLVSLDNWGPVTLVIDTA
jgi:D-tyrosyl-tRNA(Tyr) deacylase